MRLFTFLKQALILGCLLLSLQSFAKETQTNKRNDIQAITQLYYRLDSKPNLSLVARLKLISGEFLGKPYLLGALGEGNRGEFDQFPLYRTDAFDCETFVDTVLALALATQFQQFKSCINKIRYRNGKVSFIDRNHFTCLDWNKNNQHQGFTKDITTTILDTEQHRAAKFAHALINKPAWYQHFSTKNIRLNNPNPMTQKQRLQQLQQLGSQLSVSNSTLPYIPFSKLFTKDGQANHLLFKQIPEGAILEIVRPNWDLTAKIGTHLNISHLGFVFYEKGVPFFREASSTHQRVVDVPLIDYLRDAQKSPTIKGINIQVVLPSPC